MDRSLYFLFTAQDLVERLDTKDGSPGDNGDWGYNHDGQGKIRSKFQKEFINYKGQPFQFDTYNPHGNPKSLPDKPSYLEDNELSFINIVKESKKYPMMELTPADFLYLKDLNRIPINRLVVLRRFPGPVDDNLFMTKTPTGNDPMKPIATAIGWVPLDEDSFFEMSYSEEWENFGDNIASVAREAFGTDVFGKMGGPKVPGLPMFEDIWGEGLNFKILQRLGLVGGDLLSVVGNPNLITSARIRKSPSDSSFDDGMITKLNFELETTYEMRQYGNIDSATVMLDIISNLINMGIQNSAFEYTNAVNKLGKKITFMLLNGDVIGVVRLVIEELKELVLGVAKDVVKFLNNAVSAGKDDVEKGSANNIGNLLLGSFQSYLEARLGFIIAKYRVKIFGALANMTGTPTGTWHLTIGHPLRPVISMGNLVLDDAELELGNELGYNDFPTTINAEFKLSTARNRGAQELQQIFNQGKGRIYYKTAELIRGVSGNLETARKNIIDSLGKGANDKSPSKLNGKNPYQNPGDFQANDDQLRQLTEINDALAAEQERKALRGEIEDPGDID